MNKTVRQHVHKRESITVTSEEVVTTETKYEYKCDFVNVDSRRTEQCTYIGQVVCITMTRPTRYTLWERLWVFSVIKKHDTS